MSEAPKVKIQFVLKRGSLTEAEKAEFLQDLSNITGVPVDEIKRDFRTVSSEDAGLTGPEPS